MNQQTQASLTPGPFTRFVFEHCSLTGGDIRLTYRMEGSEETLRFEERLKLPTSFEFDDSLCNHPAIVALLRGVHLAAGVSYWKAFCPREMVVEGYELSEQDARYWQEVYTSGLGEFFYRNQVSPVNALAFRGQGGGQQHVLPNAQPRGVLVLVGGGKDSAVSAEIARESGDPVTLVSLGVSPWIRRAAAASGFDHLVIERSIDRSLLALNAKGARNGHVPISAIIAHVTTLFAALAGFNAIISSNERSASEGNLMFDGLEINHQWSKGLRFESEFQRWVTRQVQTGPTYFSLLRPLSELAIARLFSRLPRYFESVTSCNANFKIDGLGAPERWCGHCPKCVFVFSVVRPFVTESVAQQIFGKDILANADNGVLVQQLLGLRDHKPFECVGTPEETLAGLLLYCKINPDHANQGALACVNDELTERSAQQEQLLKHALEPSGEHRIPTPWKALLDDFIRRTS